MQTLKRQIQGYKSAPPQPTTENKPAKKPKVPAISLVVILVGSFFLIQLLQGQFSTLSIILVAATIAVLLVSLGLGIKRYKRAKLFGAIAVGFTVFVMVYGALGFYFTQFYGPTVPQVGYPNTLDIPLTSHLQTLEQSASFQFIEAQHFGTVTFESLSIHSTYSNSPQGGVEWNFHAGDTNSRLMVGQSSGKPYSYVTMGYVKGQALPEHYPSDEQTTEAFGQFDSLGLHWFYDQAVLEYQKTTGSQPNATALTLDVGYDEVGDYSGFVLVITGNSEVRDDSGAKVYPLVFRFEFQPDGTILSAKNVFA
ncbi:MAG: hypothetical protein ACQCN6_14625 [Candidatus Bathyarchaeia archaeon]